MKETASQEVQAIGSDPLNRAVLVLPDPPAPYATEDWYSRSITGVPFLLLNLLNLQKGGIQQITVYHPGLKSLSKEELNRLFADKRLSLDISWADGFNDLEPEIEKDRLFLDGSVLFDKNVIRDLLNGNNNGSEGYQSIKATLTEIEDYLKHPEAGLDSLSQVADKDGAQFCWLTGDRPRKLLKRKDFREQHERLLKGSGLSNDSLFDRFITRPGSRQLTRLFLNTSLSPNQITLISLIIGLLASICFLDGGYIGGVMGATLLLLSAWVDCTDGEVARLKFQESEFGGLLDIVSDNIVHVAVFFSIGMGLYFSTEKGIYKILGNLAVIGTLVSFALMQSAVVKSKQQAAEGEAPADEQDFSARLANRDFVYILFALALLDQVALFIWMTGIGANVFALYLMYQRFIGTRPAAIKRTG